MSGLSLETLHRAGLSAAVVAIPSESGPLAEPPPAPLRWTAEAEVDAGADRVWDAIEDLSAIPRYHPEVDRVELVSGDAHRATGARDRCVVESGRRAGWCEERVVEHERGVRSVVDFPADTWGIGRMLDGFRVELSTAPAGPNRTRVRLRAFYRPRRWWVALADRLGLRRVMRRRAAATLRGLARHVESAG